MAFLLECYIGCDAGLGLQSESRKPGQYYLSRIYIPRVRYPKLFDIYLK